MKEEIDTILTMSAGRNVTQRGKGFNYGLRMTFESQETYQAYNDHEAHQALVANLIKPIVSDVIAIDYEF